jgi:protein-L-isoaspartate(D-aspartate) O-methyltransferase
MTDFATARSRMVDSQVRPSDVTDLRVLWALQTIERECFVPEKARDLAYADYDMPVSRGRRLLKPRVFAKLAQQANIKATDRVLDVGCALGYSAAVLAELAAEVIALEQEPELSAAAAKALAVNGKVRLVTGPLADGYSADAPYDVIVIEGATEIEPTALLRQLSDGGRLVCLLGSGPAGKATLYRRSGEGVGERPIFDAAAGVLPGFAKPPAFAF